MELASARFGVPVSQLAVRDGVADPSKSILYEELIGGKQFNLTLTGKDVNATTGKARAKAAPDLKFVGQPIQRYDIRPKVDGCLKWAVDAKAPGNPRIHQGCEQGQLIAVHERRVHRFISGPTRTPRRSRRPVHIKIFLKPENGACRAFRVPTFR
jgi:hypothetical protein